MTGSGAVGIVLRASAFVAPDYGRMHLEPRVQVITRALASSAALTGIVGPGQSFCEPVMFPERPTLVDALATAGLLRVEGRRITIPDLNRLKRATRQR